MALALSTEKLTKTYSNQLKALIGVNLKVEKGDFFALLGSNGAGKTTAIGIICGLLKSTSGSVEINGLDQKAHVNKIKRMIGLMPQEFNFNPHEPNIEILINQAGYFGIARTEAKIQAEKLLKKMELWDRRFDVAQSLSGGMKRRLMLARALMHEPEILILDEPTAGVDVELRQEMWKVVENLRETGVTVILTTHYIEEAEAIADRVGIIDKGQLLLVEEKESLMQRLGQKQLTIELQDPLKDLPSKLSDYDIVLAADRQSLIYTYNMLSGRTGINQILSNLTQSGIIFKDLQTKQSSLEDIFMSLVNETVE